MPYTTNDVNGIGLDQFRSAVNYEDMVTRPERANKGYVRFVSGGRSVSLAKVNNKIDLGISLRIGINDSNNRLMRQQFLNAISGDLAHFDEKSRNQIESAILGTGDNQIKPLSRREIQNVFSLFDQGFNTASGRRHIVEDILRQSALSHGFNRDGVVDIESFCQRVFGSSKDDFVNRYADAFKGLDDATEVEKKAGRAMLMSEAEFRGLLITIREITDAYATASRTENGLRETVKGWVQGAVKGSYGFELTEAEREDWKNALRPLVSTFACEKLAPPNMVGANFREQLLTLFVDRVLTCELKVALDNVFQVGADKDPARLEEALEAYVSYNSIEDLAVSFFGQASDPQRIAAISDFAMKDTDSKDLAQQKGMMNLFIAKMFDIGVTSSVEMNTKTKLMSHASVDRTLATKVGQSVSGAVPVFAQEARVDWFVKKFLFDRYGERASEKPEGAAQTFVIDVARAKADEAARLATVAAQSVFGIRIVEWGEDRKVKSVYSGTDTMSSFANKVVNTLTQSEILKELDCDANELYAFATLTFPNVYSDIKAELLKAGQGQVKERDLFSDDNAARLVYTLKANFQKMREEVAGYNTSVAGFRKSFVKILDKYVKGGKITETQANEVKAKMSEEIKSIRNASARELAMLMPLGTDEAKAKQARWIMSDGLETLRSRLWHRLASLARTNSLGFAQKRDLDVDLNVKLAIENWKAAKQADGFGVDPYDLHLISDEEIASHLYPQLVTDFEESLAAKLPKGDDELRPADVASVRKDFAKKVADRLKAFRTYEKDLFKTMVSEGVETMMASLEDKASYKNLPSADRKAMSGEVIRNAMLMHRAEIREALFDALDHAGKSEKAKQVALDLTQGHKIAVAVNRIMLEREDEFDRWMEGGALRTRMEADVFAAFKDRLPAGVTQAELQEIIKSNGEAFFTQAVQVKGFTVGAGKQAFCNRASAAILNGLEERLAKFASFKSGFEAQAGAVESKYASMANLPELRARCLLQLAALKPSQLSLAKELDVYDKFLYAELNHVIDGQKADFANYRDAYIEVYDRAELHFDVLEKDIKDKLNVALADVDGEGLDRKALVREMLATFRKDVLALIGYQIASNPQETDKRLYKDMDKLVAAFVEKAAANVTLFAVGSQTDGEIKASDAPWMRLDDMIRDLGLGYYLAEDNAVTDRLHAHLNTFMKGDAFKAVHAQAIKAAAAHAWMEVSGAAVSEASADAIQAYGQAIKDEVKRFIATTCSIENLNNDIPLAKAFIDLELNSRNLPDDVDGYGLTVRTRTEQVFAEKVAQEAKAMFEASAKGETYESTLMSPASLDAFVAGIEADCFTTYAKRLCNDLSAEIFDAIVSRNAGFATAFVYDGTTETDEGSRMAAVVALNRASLLKQIVAFVSEQTSGCTTYAQLSGYAKGSELRKAMEAKVDQVLAATMTACLSRANFERNLNYAVDTATESFERAIFLWMFATPSDVQPPVASLAALEQRAKDDPIGYRELSDGAKWSDHRMAIVRFRQDFRKAVINHLAEVRKNDGSALYTVADVVRTYGNGYLDDLLCNEKYMKETKAKLVDLAHAIAKKAGYTIPNGRNGIFGFLKNIF